VLEISDTEVFYYYCFTCFTAPFAGIAAGGIIFSLIGGYNTSKAVYVVGIVGCASICVALPVPFLTTKIPVYILVWLLLFFGALIMPTSTGMMLNSVPLKLRATGNAVA
jgi:hypothetical protein